MPPGYMQLRNGPPAGVIRTGSGSRPGTRIDPAQMPRPDAAPPQPEAQVFETRLAGKHNIPPPSSHQIAVRCRPPHLDAQCDVLESLASDMMQTA